MFVSSGVLQHKGLLSELHKVLSARFLLPDWGFLLFNQLLNNARENAYNCKGIGLKKYLVYFKQIKVALKKYSGTIMALRLRTALRKYIVAGKGKRNLEIHM